MKSSQKIVLVLILLVNALPACQIQTTRREAPARVNIPALPSDNAQPTPEDIAPPPPVLPAEKQAPPKLGIILGPGGLRTYAEIGFVEELSKAQIPVAAIAGIETGALVAALYANKGQAFEVEWQMFKLKEEDFIHRGLLGQGISPGKIVDWSDYLEKIFGLAQAEDSKVAFSCPAFSLAKGETLIMSRGAWKSLLPYCLPLYPFFDPYRSNIASTTDLALIAKQLQSKGAEYIVYVDVLGAKGIYWKPVDSLANAYWTLISRNLMGQSRFVHQVISLNLPNQLDDFPQRRAMLQIGRERGRQFADEYLKEHGF
jgi:NTE family protein